MTTEVETIIWALHVHENVLVEQLTSPIEVRREYIRQNKPLYEIPLRLWLLKVVENVPESLRLAWTAYGKAWEAYRLAWIALGPAMDGIGPARTTYDQARAVYDQAWAAYQQVSASPEVEAWHREVCVPDCPWDGKTIFP